MNAGCRVCFGSDAFLGVEFFGVGAHVVPFSWLRRGQCTLRCCAGITVLSGLSMSVLFRVSSWLVCMMIERSVLFGF